MSNIKLVCYGCNDLDGDAAGFDTVEQAYAHESEGENARYAHEYVIEEVK